MVDNVPAALRDLKSFQTLSLEVVKASPDSKLQVGQQIVIKGTDILAQPNGVGLIGRTKGDDVPLLNLGGDKTVSSNSGQIIYKYNQFAMRIQSSGAGFNFVVAPTQKYQLLPDQYIRLEGSTTTAHVSLIYPNNQITGKDQLLLSPSFVEGEETVPLSSFQGGIKDMTKAQIKFTLINPSPNSTENQKEFVLMTDDLKTSKEYIMGSDDSCDVKVQGVKPKAAIIGYNADLKCWYLSTNDKNGQVYLSTCTLYQVKKKSLSSHMRLIPGMMFGGGKECANVFKVQLS